MVVGELLLGVDDLPKIGFHQIGDDVDVLEVVLAIRLDHVDQRYYVVVVELL